MIWMGSWKVMLQNKGHRSFFWESDLKHIAVYIEVRAYKNFENFY